MSNLNFDLQERRKDLGKHLREYLEQNGTKVASSGQMKCWLGTHQDNNPSMTLMKPDYARCYCYSCGSSADIFDATNILEGKPLKGKGFILDNLNYLSRRFGYKPLELELSAEDERELMAERIHRIAAGAFRKRLHIEQAKKRGWFDQGKCRLFGIGTIEKADDFIQFIMKTAKVTKQDIEDSGIDIRMFGPHMLTFILEDERGDCIGFASRNMNYEAIRERDKSASVQKYLNPPNSAPLYVKGRFVYNLNRAKRHRKVVMVEGYTDPFTAHVLGIENVAGYGSAGTFNEDKIEAMLRAGVNSIVLAGGYDFKKGLNKDGKLIEHRVGQVGTMKALKTLRKYPNMRVRVFDFSKLLPEYMKKYPKTEKVGFDEYLLAFGAERVQKLIDDAIPAVKFTVDELKASGITDIRSIVEELVEIISFEPDPLEVPDQITIAAEATNFDREAIEEAVKRKRRMLDDEHKRNAEELVTKFTRRIGIAKSTMDIVDMASDLSKKLEKLDPRNMEVAIDQEMQWIQTEEERSWDDAAHQVYKTGLPFFDKDMKGGLPVGAGYILFPGDTQTGKSMVVQRITYGLLTLNTNVDVVVMASDDGRVGWLHRLWCMYAETLNLSKCKRPTAYMEGSEFADDINRLKEAQAKVATMIQDRRLVLRDSGYGTRISSVRRMIETHYRRTDRDLVVILDGIHKLSGTTKQEVLDDYSSEIKQMGQEFGIPFIVTAELRKRSAENGFTYLSEPTEEDIKGSRQLVYDADAIYIMDNPIRRMRERRDQKDRKGNDIPCYKDFPNTYWEPEWSRNNPTGREVHYPYLWTHRTKNKLHDEHGQTEKYYSKFTPTLMRFEHYEPPLMPDNITMEIQNA